MKKIKKPTDISKLRKEKRYLILLKSSLVNNSLFSDKEKTDLTEIYNKLIAKYEIAINNKLRNIDVNLQIYNV